MPYEEKIYIVVESFQNEMFGGMTVKYCEKDVL
jgi:hypothetical protein